MTVLLVSVLFVFPIIFSVFSGVVGVVRSQNWRNGCWNAYISSVGLAREASGIKIYIIIPALREQAVIAETLSWFERKVSSFHKIVIALDSNETPDKRGATTFSAITEFLQEHPSFSTKIQVVTYYGTDQKRAYQINCALSWARGDAMFQGLDPINVFVAVFDADSRPHENTMSYLCWRVNQNPDVRAFQQELDYRQNIAAIREVPNNRSLLEGNAAWQTAWNSIFEIPRFLQTNREISNGRAVSFPPYCMGHGEFVRLDVFERIGGVSERGVADGIQLGFTLTELRIPIEPIPWPDVCQSPLSCKELIGQHSLWFAGNLSVFRHIWSANTAKTIQIRQSVSHLLLNIKWLFRPLYIVGAACATLWMALDGEIFGWVGLLAIVSSIFFYGVFLAFYFGKRENFSWAQTTFSQATGRLAFSCIRYAFWILMAAAFKSLGAWVGLIKVIKGKLSGKPPKYKKIERTASHG